MRRGLFQAIIVIFPFNLLVDSLKSFSFFSVTDSMNSRAAEAADRGGGHGTIVCTDAQTGGRGRFDHRWESPPGNSLLPLRRADAHREVHHPDAGKDSLWGGFGDLGCRFSHRNTTTGHRQLPSRLGCNKNFQSGISMVIEKARLGKNCSRLRTVFQIV